MLQMVLKLLSSKFAKLAGIIVFIAIILIMGRYVFPKTKFIIWILIACTILLIYVIWLIISHYKAKRRNKALSKHLIDGAGEDVANVRPDLRDKYRKTKQNLENAINKLEKSHTKGSGQALYRLPWIMIVGPPADGKTTAIQNSGISWPEQALMDEAAGVSKTNDRKIKGLGGTRSCNWFFSSNAIIIDTAGRFEAREQGAVDEEEWLQFLGMLKKARPRRPINGVIALCSIERVMQSREESQKWARKIRIQLKELMEELQTHVPVYLIFNKCDLIHGFVEYFQDLNEEKRNQMWGFTRKYQPKPMPKGSGLPSERNLILSDFEREFDNLIEVLEMRRMHRLSDPQTFPKERAVMTIFPGEVEGLKEPIKMFLSDVFEDNPFGNNPHLRGIYFTSATQEEGSPIVQLMQQVAGDFDIPIEALPLSSNRSFNTYFIRDLMKDVVFKDKQLAGRFKNSFFDRSRIALAVGLAVITILLSLWMISAYSVNSLRNSELSSSIKRVQDTQPFSRPNDKILALDHLQSKLINYAETGKWYHIFNWALGVHKSSELFQKGEHLLVDKMDDFLLANVWEKCTKQLNSGLYNLMQYILGYKTYLYLSKSENAEYIPTETVANYIFQEEMVLDDNDQSQSKKLVNILNYYMHSNYAKLRIYDSSLAHRGEDFIRQHWSWSKFTEDLLKRREGTEDYFSIEDYEYFTGPVSIPIQYTAPGWHKFQKSTFDSCYHDFKNDIIISSILNEDFNESQNPMYEVYFNQCKNIWLQFFNDLQIDTKELNTKALLDTLANSINSPIKRLLTEVGKYTSYTNIPDERFKKIRAFVNLLNAAPDVSMPNKPEDKSGNIDDYINSLNQLKKIVSEFRSKPYSANFVSEYSQTSQRIRNLRENAVNYPSDSLMQAVGMFLKRPFDLGRKSISAYIAGQINRKWQVDYYQKFDDEFGNKFPFSQRTDREVNLDKLINFFADLKTYNDTEVSIIRSSGLGITSQYSQMITEISELSNFIEFLEESGLTMICSIDLVNPLITRICIDGPNNDTILDFRNGPPETFDLPVLNTNDSLVLYVSVRDGGYIKPRTFKGTWANLKLLDEGKISNGQVVIDARDNNGRIYNFGFSFADQNISFGEYPQIFTQFRLSQKIIR
jgi:type VI secretion system IcmF/VasK family protein